EGVSDAGGDPSLEARYAALLSYALTDMGEIAKAEEVVRRALNRVGDSSDPYMRVRLYWSIARLAHTQGREAVALENGRKAIALALCTESQQMEQGISAHALADALALTGAIDEASTAYRQAVDLLEATGQWRTASAAARAWGRLLREQGQESEALDVLDRAADL